MTQDVSRILWYYYNDSVRCLRNPCRRGTIQSRQLTRQRTLFIFCFANEAFFVCLYLAAYWTTPIAPHFLLPETFLHSDLARDHPKVFGYVIYYLTHATWPQVVAALTFPIMFGKQVINVVQFWKASKIVSRFSSLCFRVRPAMDEAGRRGQRRLTWGHSWSVSIWPNVRPLERPLLEPGDKGVRQ